MVIHLNKLSSENQIPSSIADDINSQAFPAHMHSGQLFTEHLYTEDLDKPIQEDLREFIENSLRNLWRY